MTNLSWSVLSGVLRPAASILRCDSSDALNAAAEPNRLAMASLPFDPIAVNDVFLESII